MISDEDITTAAHKHGLTVMSVTSPEQFIQARNAFAREIERISRQQQREDDAAFVDHILREGGGTYGDAIRNNKEQQ